MSNDIIFAIDSNDIEKSLELAKKTKGLFYTIKLGLEFFNSNGKKGIQKFNEEGFENIMLDLKLHDIPETVYKSIKALDNIKFKYLTVHGQGGGEMIRMAKKAASEIFSKPKILVVTILTSLKYKNTRKKVIRLSKISKNFGDGIICSGKESKIVRKILGPDLLIFTPGVRFTEDKKDDQVRICNPFESIKNGSNKVIMGRSLIREFKF